MHYITEKESETGKKFQELLKKKEKAEKERLDFANKYGFSQFRKGLWCVWGGISSCVNFTNPPDKKLWGKGLDHGEFIPKRNSKAGKAIDKEIQELTTVSKLDVNMCIGYKCDFTHTIGFNADNEKYFGFSIGDDWEGISIPSDCKEVLTSKYKEMFK